MTAIAEKILVITDDPLVESLVSASIRSHPDWQHCLIETCNTLRKALGEITVSHYQAILVDVPSFDHSPIEILIQLRAADKKTPLLIINRPGMEKTAVSCLKHGADYYLVKNKGWEADIPSVINSLLLEQEHKHLLKRRISHLEQENRRLKGHAALDEDTLFYTSQHFESVLSRELNRASRYGLNLACLLVEIREQGGNGGKKPSQESFYEKLALQLKSVVRVSDIWARLNEDRFAAILPHATALQARHAIKRIDSEIGALIPSPKVRWGVAHFDKNKTKNEKEFLSLALDSLKRK